MQLSRKQVILISVISGVVLLLTLAIALIYTPGAADLFPEPTPSPAQTACPTPTPSPMPTPTPTAFRLPLVPQWDTPRPTADPWGALDALVPRGSTPPSIVFPTGTAGPWVQAW